MDIRVVWTMGTSQEVLKRASMLGRLPFLFDRIGRWWDAREEVGIVALGSG